MMCFRHYLFFRVLKFLAQRLGFFIICSLYVVVVTRFTPVKLNLHTLFLGSKQEVKIMMICKGNYFLEFTDFQDKFAHFHLQDRFSVKISSTLLPFEIYNNTTGLTCTVVGSISYSCYIPQTNLNLNCQQGCS